MTQHSKSESSETVKFIEKSDPSLPGLEPETRQKIYSSMNRTIAKIHSVDVEKAGLSDYGKVYRHFFHDLINF